MWPTKSKKCSVMDMKVNFMAGYPAFFYYDKEVYKWV